MLEAAQEARRGDREVAERAERMQTTVDELNELVRLAGQKERRGVFGFLSGRR